MRNNSLKQWQLVGLWLVLAATLPFCGCNDEKMILGAGSTFDNLLFSKMFYEYHTNKTIKVNYQSVGSGGGIKALTDEIVDFAATDAPLTPDQEKATRGHVLHIPVTAGAVVLSYNLPGIKDTICFTPEALSGIFLGKIKWWDDTALTNANPGINLPHANITVVHRTDGSGTTNIFTTYLCKVSHEWEKQVGRGSAVYWPVGLGGKGNEGVGGTIQQSEGALGYTELAFAVKNGLTFGKVRNQAGNYIAPSVNSVTSAANVPVPADGKVFIANTTAADGYPLAGFSWVLLYKEQQYNGRSLQRAQKIVQLLNWMIHEGQQYAATLNYAPLSPTARATGEQMLREITFNGQPVLK